jgi:RND family efflux transporter MFP subunit
MKRSLLYIALGALVFTSCQEKPNSDYDTLLAKRDSMKKEYKELGKAIRKVEKELESFETEKKRTLVSSWTLEAEDFAHFFKVHGVVQAKKNVLLYAESSSRIDRIYVKEGQRVNTGQLLLEMDSEMIRNSIMELEKNLELANDVYERQAKLWEQNIGSEIQYLEAKNRKESIEQSLATMKVQLEKTKVYAPFAGVIDKVFPREGELAGMQMPMFRLVNLDKIYVQSDVSEAYIARIEKGTYAEVTFPSIGVNYESEISRVGEYINPNNRTFEMQVDLINVNNHIKPNLLAEVKVRDFFAENALAIPIRLVQQDAEGKEFVYLMNSTDQSYYTVEKRYVETGVSYEDRIMILEGVIEGDMFVDKGSRSVKEGQEVKLFVADNK